jgi:pyruvate dehydrogenase E1 component
VALRDPIISEAQRASAGAPADPDWLLERLEWHEALESLLRAQGPRRVRELLDELGEVAVRLGAEIGPESLNTPYRNSIPVSEQPEYPGDVELEERIDDLLRWNATAMVVRANQGGAGVGGHLSTYASAATLFEVGFQHFFRARSGEHGGDIVYFQPHASPGVYARAFLEGRLGAGQLDAFRRELQPEGGLPSYPHPRRLPWFWQVPTASMGLSAISAVYQARFARYLESRGLKPKNGGRVWAFLGDGECDEPEVMGAAAIAARERLDNLVVVVNCNLQRLDGPVRGNGKIIQELERAFRGVGWNVLKVIWGGEWDALFARDTHGVLQARMEEAVDGDYQMYTTLDGRAVRAHWVRDDPELAEIMKTLSDEEIRTIRRGGHDRRKLYAAYRRACRASGKPTAILVKTIKGFGLGGSVEGSNTTHQKKAMSERERFEVARRFGVPLSDDQVRAAAYYRPPDDAPEMVYLRARREALGGFVPERRVECPSLPAPALDVFADLLAGSGERPMSTTLALVRVLQKLLRDPALGRFLVPIIADEARTFGMDGLFRQAGIYAPEGQLYTPVDAGTILPYREARDGQILQEGICEAGALASFIAAGTAYAHHGVPALPFYVFYSMFGFQRVGDLIWSAADQLARCFRVGGTAGRTTLNGEGVQHQDGHSQLVAATVPNLESYDPAFAYELAVIVRDGIRRMVTEQEEVFFYLTAYNESYPMPAMPEGAEEAILRGLHRVAGPLEEKAEATVHLLGSGSILLQAVAAQRLLAERGVAADVWSVTSWVRLHRDAAEVDRWNRLHPESPPRRAHLAEALAGSRGVFVAVSDWMRMLPDALARWVPGRLVSLGADGFGLSEARPDIRRHFEVSAADVAAAAWSGLAAEGAVEPGRAARELRALGIDPERVWSLRA